MLLIHYWYRLLFPLCVIEGPLVWVLAWFLIFSWYFSWWWVILILCIADIVWDLFYYYIWHFSSKSMRIQRYINKFTFLKTHIHTMKWFWEKHPAITMLLWKNAYWISVAVIISAWMDMSLWKFLEYSVPVSILQTILLIGTWYLMGDSYDTLSQYVDYPFVFILVFFVVFILLYKKIGTYAAKHFE